MTKHKTTLLTGAALIAALSGCATTQTRQPVERAPSAPAALAPPADKDVATTIVGGEAAVPSPTRAQAKPKGTGNIEFTIPSADVRTLARIVLRDTLGIPYSVDVEGDVDVGLSTSGPVNREQLLELFEAALKKANLAMVWQGSGYKIMTIGAAKAEGTAFLPDKGFGTETVTLQFANADELKKLLDSVVPGAVQSVESGRNTMVIAGTAAQRRAAHDIIAQFDVNWLRTMSFALYVPERTDARLIAPELEKLINAPDAPTRGLVRLIAMDKLNGIVAISAQKQYLEDVRRWIEILDREGTNNEPRLYVYRVQNGRAKDLVKTINTTFGFAGGGTTEDTGNSGNDANRIGASTGGGEGENAAQRNGTPGARPLGSAAGGMGGTGGPSSNLKVRVSNDDVNNAVVVFGSAHDYAIVEDALRKLDVAPMQVMIEAAITEVGLNDDLRYGLQWNVGGGQSNLGYSEGADKNPTQVFPGFSYFYTNSNDITATLNALEQRTNVRVVSAPKLLVLNNQTAALQVGDQVPIKTQQSQSTIGGTSPVINSIEYRDTGVILKITPRVNASGTVLLDVAQEVSDVSTTKSSDISSPTISTRKVATSVAVQDGQVIALGGLFKNAETLEKNGIPILSRLPVVGGLFGTHSNTARRTELIVLIKPHVLRNPDDLSAITEEMRTKVRSLEPFKTKGRIP